MKKRILFLLASALLLLCIDRYAMQRIGVPVLMYHDLSTDEAACVSDWTLQPDRLREDLVWLRDHGYTTVLPHELATGKLDDGSPLPRRIVLLTFDDGYESNFTLAQPILEEFGARAAVAVIVSRIGQEAGFLTWDQCRAMLQSGVWEFGSHTYDRHIRDDALGVSRLDGETREQYTARIAPDIEKSVELLRSELGIDVRYFAYPLGKVDEWCDDILAPYFDVTVTTQYGCAARAQTQKLPRFNVTQRVRAADHLT